MSQSSSPLNSGYTKSDYIRLLFRCVLSLIICSYIFNPLTAFSATGGGGSTRGGGAGKKSSIGLNYKPLIKGIIRFPSNGNMTLEEYSQVPIYTNFVKISDTDNTKQAGSVGISNIFTAYESVDYWITFYNYNGSVWSNLGSTAKFKGMVNTEVPYRTTHAVITSNSQSLEGVTYFEGEGFPLASGPSATFAKYENVWLIGGQLLALTGKPYGKVSFNSVESLSKYATTQYYYDATYGDLLYVKSNTSMTLYLHEFDSEYNQVNMTSTQVYGGVNVTVEDTRTRYIKLYFSNYDVLYDSAWKNAFTITGLKDTVSSTAYQVDDSSTSTIVNNHNYVQKTYDVVSGDNSPVIIIDGDNNTINIPGSSPILPTAPPPVLLPDEIPPDDDNKPWYEKLFDFFGGIFDGTGKLLGALLDGLSVVIDGITDILLLPIKFIVDTLKDVLELLKSTLESLGGLAEFFSQVFLFLPSPIPEILTLFIPAILVVAIVKMFI